MTAPDQLQNVKLALAKREPSTHDPKRMFNVLARYFALRLVRGNRCSARHQRQRGDLPVMGPPIAGDEVICLAYRGMGPEPLISLYFLYAPAEPYDPTNVRFGS